MFVYLSLLHSGISAILKYFLRDFDPGVLEVHDRVGDLDPDGIHDSLDVKGAVQSLTENLEVF